jgi:hypothetical protein
MHSILVPVRYSDSYGALFKNKFPCKTIYVRCLVFIITTVFVTPLVEQPVENMLFLFGITLRMFAKEINST